MSVRSMQFIFDNDHNIFLYVHVSNKLSTILSKHTILRMKMNPQSLNTHKQFYIIRKCLCSYDLQITPKCISVESNNIYFKILTCDRFYWNFMIKMNCLFDWKTMIYVKESDCMLHIYNLSSHWRSKVKPKNCKFLYIIYTCVMYLICCCKGIQWVMLN